MLLSIVMPAYNEAETIGPTVTELTRELTRAGIHHEILVVNDNSRDNTEHVLQTLEQQIPQLRHVNNQPPNGFGFAVRRGLEDFSGDVVAVVMADGSDLPQDVVAFFRQIEQGYDCVFGSRFIRGGAVTDYPRFKLALNRGANTFISLLFQIPYNDVTNAFKMYRREVIEGIRPLLSHHFNLTVEMPLKAIVRGYSFTVLPNAWQNRKAGESKLKIKEMGSRYLFIVLYCFIEKWLARGDYHRQTALRHHQARSAAEQKDSSPQAAPGAGRGTRRNPRKHRAPAP